MKPRYVLNALAEVDIVDIIGYLEPRNPKAAARWVRELRDAFRKLAAAPQMGSLFESDSPRLGAIRTWTLPHFRNYVIYYEPISNGIRVLRVSGGGRDAQRLLRELNEGVD